LWADPNATRDRAIFASVLAVMGMSRYGLFPQAFDTETNRASPRSDPPSTPDTHSVAPVGLTTGKRKVSVMQSRVIDAMYETLGTLDHHELLSVRRDASSLEIRCAYESLLAAFHPRRFERTALGEHSEKLDAIIRRIHEAYTALSTPTERASYDARFGKPDR
jgi:DnaJ-domain-containing protein 1